MQVTSKKIRIPNIFKKFPFLLKHKKIILIVGGALVFGSLASFLTIAKERNQDPKNVNDETDQSYDSEDSDPTDPNDTDTDLGPKKLSFSSPNYSTTVGGTVALTVNLLDERGQKTTALASTAIKVTGEGINATINIATGSSSGSTNYKVATAGSHVITASSSGLASATTRVAVSHTESLVIQSPASGTALTDGITIQAKYTGGNLSGKTIQFTTTCDGYFTPVASDTNESGIATTKWYKNTGGVTPQGNCTIMITSGSLSDTKSYTVA